MNSFSNCTISLGVVAILGSGCGGKYFRPYVQDPTAATIIRTEEAGLKISINPLLDLQSCKTNFGIDCIQKGILPVYLAATNGNPSNSFRIIASDIWFGAGKDRTSATGGLQQTNNISAGSNLGVAGGVIAGITLIPGILVAGAGMKATDDEESIRENFVIKQFQNVTLSPGRSAEGFVYFVQHEPISTTSLPPLNIAIRNLSNNDSNWITLPLVKTQ